MKPYYEDDCQSSRLTVLELLLITVTLPPLALLMFAALFVMSIFPFLACWLMILGFVYFTHWLVL